MKAGLSEGESSGPRSAHRARRASPAITERLETRQLLTAVVVAPTTAPTVGTTPLAPMPGKTFWVDGLGTSNAWQFASSITPNTTNDLVLNVAPFNSLYTACCEGADSAPGSTAQAGQLLTNGLTQNQIGNFPASGAVAATGSGQISDPSSGENVLSDLADQPWWFEYNLGAQPGATPSPTGYDISEIDVITGHQDFRTGQNTDIDVQFVGSPGWDSLSAGQNFNFTRDQNGTTLDRGAAQMAIVNSAGGAIVSNVQAVKFVASNSNTWYRELVVIGTPSSALPVAPGPSVPAGISAVNDANNPGNIDVAWHDGASTSTTKAAEFQIQRAPVVNGVTGAFVPVGAVLGNGQGAADAFTDLSPPGGTYVYEVFAFNSFNDGTLSAGALSGAVSVHVLPAVLSINRTTPAGPVSNGGSVVYTVTFNQTVTGVNPTDFALALTGSVAATTPVVVTGSGAVYTVTVSGVSGSGTLGLNVVDNGSIHDLGRTMSFQAGQQNLATGSHPRSVALADVNGDGKPDLIVADFSGNSVAVLLGNGDGTFKPPQTYFVGSSHTYAMSVAVVDVNGDGNKDLVIANDGANGSVSVLLGNGNGTFRPQTTFAAGADTYSLAVADVNGDGTQDIIVANDGPQNGSVGLLLGNGDGTFQAQQTVASGTYPQSIAALDVNGDNKIDLVTASYLNDTVSVILGNGNGTFLPPVTYSAGSGPTSVAIADVTGDGKPDLVVADYAGGTVGVLNGNGNGTFQGIRNFAAGAGPFSVVAADMNGDGKPDLVVANDSEYGTVSVLLGNGNGVFQVQQTYAFGASPVSIAVADINGDGKPDIAAANLNGNSVSVLIDNASLNFTGPTYTVLPLLDTMTGTSGVDQITLTQDTDHAHIDWTLGTLGGQMLINDPNGLIINGIGGADVITLNYSAGNPLPNSLHLNGTFTIDGLQGSNPLAGTTLEIDQSTVYINYAAAASPAAAIQQYLTNGYNGGTWNGVSTASTGAITSAAAASGPAGMFGVGFADSADGVVAGQPANTVELRYTLMGDANLDRVVNMTDAAILQANWNSIGSPGWDRGNFNFDASVNAADALLMTRNWNGVAAGSAAPAAGDAVLTPEAVAATPSASDPVATETAGDAAPPIGGATISQGVIRRPRSSRKRH